MFCVLGQKEVVYLFINIESQCKESMEVITSTHLKQWADTKECQSLLPELMRRLICASVKQLNRLSFPSGDAVHMPEWAGADTWVLI